MLDDCCIEACLVVITVLRPCSLPHPSVDVKVQFGLAQAFLPAWLFGGVMLPGMWAACDVSAAYACHVWCCRWQMLVGLDSMPRRQSYK